MFPYLFVPFKYSPKVYISPACPAAFFPQTIYFLSESESRKFVNKIWDKISEYDESFSLVNRYIKFSVRQFTICLGLSYW